METYRSLYEFATFVKAGKDVPDEVKALDFDELNKLLSTLPHLQSGMMEKKNIEHPFAHPRIQWRHYNPETEESSTLTSLPAPVLSSRSVESESLRSSTESQEPGPTLSHNGSG
jgi:hypothetical protein